MAEKAGPEGSSTATDILPGVDFVPLARAASLAHDRLFPEQPVKECKALDVIALALSALIPLYQRDTKSADLRKLTDGEMANGRFTRGATTLEFPDRPPLRYLVVARADLYRAIDAMAEDALITGRVSLTLRQGPRKTPPV